MSKDPVTHTEPVGEHPGNDAKVHLSVAPSYQDPTTRALYVHRDLVQVQPPWADEAHVRPMQGCEQFGDVESFVGFVKRYGHPTTTYLSWNAKGLRAVLDFADATTDAPGRAQWSALLPFRVSTPWASWMMLANGSPWSQKIAVERLEDLAVDIVQPAQADVLLLLRGLRATVNAKADSELRPDGTSKVVWEKDTKVASSTSLDVPSSFAIAIPVLKGHVGVEGQPVNYRMEVRLRVSVDDNARLTLRFSVPNAERILEDVYAERVAAAKEILGDEFALLRAADA